MKTKLGYLVLGVVLTLVVVGGAMLLTAQGDWDGEHWEYIFVEFMYRSRDNPEVMTLEINNERVAFEGDMFQLFNTLGARGYEYLRDLEGFGLWKRKRA